MTAETASTQDDLAPLSSAGPEPAAAEIPEPPEEREYVAPIEPPAFELEKETLSFAALEAGRASVYASHDAKHRFRTKVEGLPQTGDLGRRRGLGLWMLAEYERAA